MATYKDIAQIFERNKNIGKRPCTFPGLVAVVRECHETTLNELENELDVKILFLGDGSVSFHSFVWTLQ